jgi:hypothetical protein
MPPCEVGILPDEMNITYEWKKKSYNALQNNFFLIVKYFNFMLVNFLTDEIFLTEKVIIFGTCLLSKNF